MKSPRPRTLFVLGTASHSGKSVVAAGLCRHFRRCGVRVAPFKSQNMALNSAVTPSGHEMGRAQAMQAEAAGVEPRVEMNPILLKPTGNHRIQVVLEGKVYATMSPQEYYRQKPFFLQRAIASHQSLQCDFDLIVAEGAGSPTEMNLLDRDIVNLPLARFLDASCILVGDIDRGGVFAALVGTRELCSHEDRQRIQGFVINKFRGQKELFEDGIGFLQERTGWPCLGVVPFFEWLQLDEEDSVSLASKKPVGSSTSALRIAVARLPFLSNYTDFDNLERSGAGFVYAASPEELESADLIVLPGSKNTIEDLLWLRERGWEDALKQATNRGAFLLGICGGFQMLGRRIQDPHGVESSHGAIEGFGLLEMDTVLASEKTTLLAEAVETVSGLAVQGYEIHMGQSRFDEIPPPFFRLAQRGGRPVSQPEGAVCGRVMGTYLHGIFSSLEFTRHFLERVAVARGKHIRFGEGACRQTNYDRWADALEQELDLTLLHRIAGLAGDLLRDGRR